MNINQELIKDLILQFLSAIPQLVFVVSLVLSSLKSVKKTTALFPNEIALTKDTLKKTFEENAEKVYDHVAGATNEFLSTLKNMAINFETEVKGLIGIVQEKMTGFETEIKAYKDQINLLVMENKILFDTLIEQIAQNPKKIKEGIAKVVSSKFNMAKEELEKYPELLTNGDSKLLEKALRNFAIVAGRKNLDELLGKFGYEKKKKEEL